MKEIERLRKAIAASVARDVNKQASVIVEFATVKSVEGNTCTVQMLTDEDGVTTEGIKLGMIGNVAFKPTAEALCLVAHIMNNDAEGVVLWAEKIDSMSLNGDDLGGLINTPKLVDELNKLKTFQQKVQQVFNSWVPVPQDGGAALKAQVTQFTSLQTPNFSGLENKKITHGEQ
jgi:hypothetical protein